MVISHKNHIPFCSESDRCIVLDHGNFGFFVCLFIFDNYNYIHVMFLCLRFFHGKRFLFLIWYILIFLLFIDRLNWNLYYIWLLSLLKNISKKWYILKNYYTVSLTIGSHLNSFWIYNWWYIRHKYGFGFC